MDFTKYADDSDEEEYVEAPGTCENLLARKVRECTLTVTPNTDLYRRPGKEFNNADIFTIPGPEGPFIFSCRVTIKEIKHEFQQAGIVLFGSPIEVNDNWIKAGVEFYAGQVGLSTVITRGSHGSDWAIGEFSRKEVDFWIQFRRNWKGAIEIIYDYDGFNWTLARKSYDWGLGSLQLGVYGAAPEGPSFDVEFSEFIIIEPHMDRERFVNLGLVEESKTKG
ncbi:hypothetical protein HDU97_001229 [Phlyctochytrium planicorne]|nr:hypothetical protein HDU97_001229 [Phlyctochytrium planicorne]